MICINFTCTKATVARSIPQRPEREIREEAHPVIVQVVVGRLEIIGVVRNAEMIEGERNGRGDAVIILVQVTDNTC